MIGFHQNGIFMPLDKLIDAQEVVDRINVERRKVREAAFIRALCRKAAIAWIEANPIKARMSYAA